MSSPTALPVRRLLFFLLLAAFSHTSAALTTTIDDSGTFTRAPTVLLRWGTPSHSRHNSTLMAGTTTVQVRLNVTAWLRHTGRIYLMLPAQPPGLIHAAWTTQGKLLPGQVTSGSRTLVYSGAISTPYLEDVLQLSISVDGRQMQQTYPLDFRFEMETS